MLSQLVSASLRFRGIVVALALLLLAYGSFLATRARLDVFPEFVQPQVTIQAEAPGLTPEQVETLVTRPIEAAINGAGELDSVRSESIQGLSVVTAVFAEGADVYHSRQTLAEKLGELAGTLPEGVRAPKMSPLTSSTMDLLKFGLLSDRLSPMDLRTFADWTLRPRLLSVPGVARINTFGGEVREWQVVVDPARLQAFDLSVSDVLAAARAASGVRGAGFVETEAQRILVETDGQAKTPAELVEAMVAQHEGSVVRIKDVARVAEGPEPRFGDAVIMGRPGVLMALSGQYGSNTLEVTRRAEAALAEMAPLLAAEGITLVPRLHRPATFIEIALANIAHSLAFGGALVAIILLLFLLDLHTAIISFLSIPLSLLAAFIVLDRAGVSINTMTLGGFAVAIGVVVDDAIIDVENIVRRLRENARLGSPRPAIEVVFDASLEVRSAVVYATFIVCIVFIPVLTMTGLQGRFFAPLATAFMLAVGASLIVALTVTPALCLLLLKHHMPHAEPRWLTHAKAAYDRLLGTVMQNGRLLFVGLVVLAAGAAATLPFFGGEFLPQFREGHFVLGVSTVPGTSLGEMRRIGTRISEELLAIPGIATVEQQIGRAEQGEDTWGPQRSEFHVELKRLSGGQEEEVQAKIRDLLESFPGVQSEVMTFLGDRIGETLSGETAPVVVSVFGDDLDALDASAAEIAAQLHNVAGTTDIRVKSPPGVPRIRVRLRPERLRQFGFRTVDVLDSVQTAYQGANVGQVYQGIQVIDVAVLLPEAERHDPESLGRLLVSNGAGASVPLGVLADISLSAGRDSIQHDGGRRRQVVTCNVEGRAARAVVADARERIAQKVKLPPGIYVSFGGAAEAEETAQRELLLHSGIAAIGIVLLLTLVFREPRHLLLVLANVPFALVGGILAVFATGGLLSLGALVGFVTLFGVTTRNSIMLISHYEHLVLEEGAAWSLETARRGARERLMPIVMTALVTGLGLLPLALGSGEAGREVEGPMAVVILGGLLSSTALTLFVLPSLAIRYGRFESRLHTAPSFLRSSTP